MNKENSIIKVCIPAINEGLESEIDPRFGRCKFFTLIELKNGKILNTKSVKNIGAEQGSGAGIAAAEQVSKLDADVVLTYDVGPKSETILDQLGIKIIKTSGTIQTALNNYINNIK